MSTARNNIHQTHWRINNTPIPLIPSKIALSRLITSASRLTILQSDRDIDPNPCKRVTSERRSWKKRTSKVLFLLFFSFFFFLRENFKEKKETRRWRMEFSRGSTSSALFLVQCAYTSFLTGITLKLDKNLDDQAKGTQENRRLFVENTKCSCLIKYTRKKMLFTTRTEYGNTDE